MTPEKNRKLKIVSHAIDRAEQFGLTPAKLTYLFWHAEPEPTPPGKRDTKFSSTTFYWRNGTYVMVVGETEHKYTGEPIYLLLTVYDQRMNLPAFMLK